MARLVFPDEGSRLIYRTTGATGALLSASGAIATVYVDDAGTELADILTAGGDAIAGSTLTVDAYSRLPLWQGPDDDTDTLYVTVAGGPLVAVYARGDDRLDAVLAGTTAHLGDAVDAHDATAVSFTPAGTIAATDVQGAIVEVSTEAAAALTAHLDDAVAAHAATAVSFSPTGTIAATTVQAAIAEVASEAATNLAAQAAVNAASYVPKDGGTQVADTFLPVFTRTPPIGTGGLSGKVGFYTGATLFNARPDPIAAMGFFGTTAADGTYSWQLEADWDVGAHGRIAECYVQVIQRTTGASRRPIYGKYNTTDNRAVAWYFMVGKGKDDTGATPQGFFVNFDDNTSQYGVGLFGVTPNRLFLAPVQTDGVVPNQVRINLQSNSTGATVTEKGSALALSWGAADPEGFTTATFLVQSVGASVSAMYSLGKKAIEISNDGTRGALGFCGNSAIVRPALGAAATDLATVITLANNTRTGLINYGLCTT